MILNS